MKKLLALIVSITMFSPLVLGARIKDLAEIQGVRDNRILGYGLVVGLNGTGDKAGSEFTIRSLANMLKNMGIVVDPDLLKVKNVAAVVVSASMPPFAKSGQRLDCTISSIGDATSLAGGTLISTPLYGPDGKVYAMAQGPVSVGGFAVSGESGTGVTKNFPTAGKVPNGAVLERSLDFKLDNNEIKLLLDNPDFTTAHRLAKSINSYVGTSVAHAKDISTVTVNIPKKYEKKVVDFISMIERIDVTPDSRAKVIVNERTGTVVMGKDVRISTVAIAHGNLSIKITEAPKVSQPTPFSTGKTVVTPRTGVRVAEGGRNLVVLPRGATIGDLVSALNAIGVSPRDLIVILQAIKAAGALHAELEII